MVPEHMDYFKRKESENCRCRRTSLTSPFSTEAALLTLGGRGLLISERRDTGGSLNEQALLSFPSLLPELVSFCSITFFFFKFFIKPNIVTLRLNHLFGISLPYKVFTVT